MSEFPFSITATPPGTLELKVGENKTFSFTVTCLAAPDKIFELELQPLLVDAEGKSKEADWLVVGPHESLIVTGGKTETVTINVRPKSPGLKGDHQIRLRVAKKDDTNEYWVDSPPVTCKVVGEGPKEPSRRPGWLIPVIIAGAVILLAGGGVLAWQLLKQKHGLEDPCDADGHCDGNLVCVAEAQKCLKPAGDACEADHASQCASGECKGDSHVCAIPLGGQCNPDDNPTRCVAQSACDRATHACTSKVSVCAAGQVRCTKDDTGLETCEDGTWKTAACPKATPQCRDAKCQCVANKDQLCGQCNGKVQCDGSCSVATPPSFGQACGKCGGVIKCDGKCSISDTACQEPPPPPGKIWRATGAPCSGNSCPGWEAIDRNPDAVRIASASGGKLYQLQSSGKIFRFTGAACSGNTCPGWQMLDNNPATVGIFADGAALYQLHNSGAIWKYTGTPCSGNSCPGWQLLDSNPATMNLAAAGGQLYQLHRTGLIWRYTGTPCGANGCPGWQLLDNNPATVSITAGNGQLFQLHDSGRIWQYTGTPCSGNSCPGWRMLDNNPATSAIIAGGSQLYQLHNSGRIWQYTGAPCTNNSCPGWSLVDANAATIAIFYDGVQLFQLHNTGRIWRYTGTPCGANGCPGWEMLDNNPLTGRIAPPYGGAGYQIHASRTPMSRVRACYECR